MVDIVLPPPVACDPETVMVRRAIGVAVTKPCLAAVAPGNVGERLDGIVVPRPVEVVNESTIQPELPIAYPAACGRVPQE